MNKMIQLYAIYKRHTEIQRHRFKVKRWEKVFHENSNQKRIGVFILILDKIDFKSKQVTRGKESHYIVIEDTIQQENITIINIYIPHDTPSKYMKQKLMKLKGEMDSSIIIVSNHYYTTLTIIDRITRQKETIKNTFFSSAHGVFSTIDYMLGYK